MAPQPVKSSPIPKVERLDDAIQDEPQRGRKKAREEDGKDSDGQENGERKRKRSRKGLDKKYPCPTAGCGKSYSRAEHLYRHQLNHTPKQIYYCDFPDCGRHFVRQDLCVRHRERHTTKGSNLQRKDNYINQALVDQTAKGRLPKVESTDLMSPGPFHQGTFDSSSAIIQSPTEPMGPPRQDSNNFIVPVSKSGLQRSNSDSQYYGDNSTPMQPARSATTIYGSTQQRHSSFGSIDGTAYNRPAPLLSNAESTVPNSNQWNGDQRLNSTMPNMNPSYTNYNQPYSTVSNMPTIYHQAPQNGTYQTQQQYYGNTTTEYMGRTLSTEEMAMQSESPMNDIAYPTMFGEDDAVYGRSPSLLPENFTNWLLDANFQPIGGRDPNGFGMDPAFQSFNFPLGPPPPQTAISVSSLLEPTSKIATMSERTRQEVIELIDKRFTDVEGSPMHKLRGQLLTGEWDSEGHVLSQQSFQTYISSYWYHFHDQMPILHKPTFSADKCQTLLLVAVLAIGAANLDKMHGQTTTAAAAELAEFLAWHLRGKLFEDRGFAPPTKLWVLQALTLLECFEKLYSSRSLHERSTIHHATTISLLRRGSALLGRSAMDSPQVTEENNKNHSVADTSDPWWDHWITNEATKRAAFALFIIDSTHAIMFGHTAVMLAHELKLALPCSDALWTATSGSDVGRLEQQLRGEGIKPLSFPEGLKMTLSGKSVRTNRFGRTALMAGLLNVTFHLSQRDLQIRTLGVAVGKEANWKATVTKAFDIWERDWDNEADNPAGTSTKNRHIRDSSHSSNYSSSTIDEEHTFESRVVLHHLAHMGMHVDVVQCQLYAKAKRLLGRTITPADYHTCCKRMQVWAKLAAARDAAFYSLKFLTAVLLPEQGLGTQQQRPPPFRAGTGEYVPRDDYLLNRPWVVYFAALVVWSYGYTLDGPLKKSSLPSLESKDEQIADMRKFMSTVGAVATPSDLNGLEGHRNGCAGLLCFLGAQFKKSRWELMHEASRLLANCVDMLRGTETSDFV